MLLRRHEVLAAVLLLAFFAAPARGGGEEVTFLTRDSVQISGELHVPAGEASGSAVIAVHMFLGDRKQFFCLAKKFTRRNVTFLSLDLRGHGQSRMRGGEDLRKKALAQDPKFFGAMHQDVAAAVSFLEERGYERSRIGLVGASLGASVVLDHAGRNQGVPCVGLLTPVLEQPGIDTWSAAKKFGRRPALVLCSKSELSKGAERLASSLFRGTQSRLEKFDAKRAHGTALLKKVPESSDMIADWFTARLAADVRLDGLINGRESGKAEVRRIDDRNPGKGSLLIRRFPDHLYLAARSLARPEALEVNVAGRLCQFDEKGITRLGGGQTLSLPLRKGSIRAVGRDAIELLLPVGGFGIDRGKELRMDVRFKAGGKWHDAVSGLRLYYPRSAAEPDRKAPSD